MSMTAEEIIKNAAVEVDGTAMSDQNVTIFTLSTCMWCRKCKRFLNEKNVKYKYIDVDKIPYKDKAEILDYLRAKYEARVSYPFLICDAGHVVGYDPNKYAELMEKSG